MIEDGQREMRLPLPVCLHQQNAPPYPIARHRARYTVLQLPPRFENQILVFLERVGDVAFPDRHLSSASPSLIEVMPDRPTARLGHESFQANDLIPDPLRFRRCKDGQAWWARVPTA